MNAGTPLRIARPTDHLDAIVAMYSAGLGFEQLGIVAGAIQSRFTTPPPQTVLGVTNLATPEILFEIEATAAQP